MSNDFLTEKQVQELNKEFDLEVPEEGSIRDDSIFGWEQCPLCPGHLDESDGFRWDHLLNAQVCMGCSYDIHDYLCGNDERPLVSAGVNYADTIMGRLEQLTGQTFHQLKFQHLKEEIKSRTGAAPKYVNGIEFMAIPEADLRILNKRLDKELDDIVAAKEKATSDEDSQFETSALNCLSKAIKENPA